MKVTHTAIQGVTVVEPTFHADNRGSFARFYCDRELAFIIGDRRIVQINHSRTSAVGAVRGMHFQSPPHSEMKLVRCLRGRVWDVAIDLRTGSPTFLQWHGEMLSREDARMMIIPEGCAHGFQVLEPNTELLYLHTNYYYPTAEGGLRHDDSRLAINWPLPVTDISARDNDHPLIKPDFRGLQV
ncbi:MAG: dTDP-4-dehydrorhamnose 3,5-epimerase [Sterolibacterium sp.]